MIKNPFLFYFLLTAVLSTDAQNLHCENLEDGVLIKEGPKEVLFYKKKERSENGKYARANYIHPLYDLNGKILTEDFPEDHLHHRGIFWAWHQVLVDNRPMGDSWECKDFMWNVEQTSADKNNDESISLHTRVLWESPIYMKNGKTVPFVEENTTITVYPSTNNYRVIDIKISLLALVEHLKLGGSNDVKGYGGFSARLKLPEDIQFSSGGKTITPKNEAVHADRWMDFNGSFNENTKSGILVIAGKNNPTPQGQWILRNQKSMQNAVYPGREAVPIFTKAPTVLQYRLVIYKNRPTEREIQQFTESF